MKTRDSPQVTTGLVREASGRRPARFYVLALIGAFILGVLSASHNEWRLPLQRLLLEIGGAQLANLEAVQSTRYGASEYLVVLAGEDQRAAARRYIDAHPAVEWLGDSVFPRTLRVAIRVPVTDAERDLETQSFARWVVPNHTLLFCQ